MLFRLNTVRLNLFQYRYPSVFLAAWFIRNPRFFPTNSANLFSLLFVTAAAETQSEERRCFVVIQRTFALIRPVLDVEERGSRFTP